MDTNFHLEFLERDLYRALKEIIDLKGETKPDAPSTTPPTKPDDSTPPAKPPKKPPG